MTVSDPLGIRGTTIHDKYAVGDVVGEGGFSVVYRAEHTIWKQPVALKCFKVLANAPADQREQLLDGFIQEGKLMASLSSRTATIVQARDIGTFETKDGAWIPFMVMEWLDGKPLDIVLLEERASGLPPREVHEAMALLEPAVVGLDIAHSKNIAHRDIKPANIFVIGDPRGVGAYVKLLDFGIAKVMAEHAEAESALQKTGSAITAFTPNYGAPEQFSRTHGATGPWTDVFALALILVEMLRGRPALEGDDLVQLAVVSRDPAHRPTPRALGVEVSDQVEAVFERALAVAPGARYATMGQFWAALYDAVFPGVGWSPATTSGYLSSAPSTAVSGTGPRGPVTPSARIPTPTGRIPTPPGATARITPQEPAVQTRDGLSATHVAPPSLPPKGKPPYLAVGALAALALGGFLAWRTFGGQEVAMPTPLGAPTGSAGVTPTASPTAVVSAAVKAADHCPEGMALVPGGKFFMGSDDPGFPLWQPAHKVTIDTFCMDVHEVTAGQYKACSDQGECKRPEPIPDYPKSESTTEEQHEKNKKAYSELCTFGKDGLGQHPINCVSWALADAYCQVHGGRLPTEAEWEYAARGSDGRKFPWGDDPGDAKHMNACGAECNKWEGAHGMKLSQTMYATDDGWPGTAPVGSFPAGRTKFGLDDMVGNVWEWTSDWFATYKADEVVNPKGAPAGEKKAIRGGGFNGGVQLWLNPAFRFHQLATASAPGIGFRCAKDLGK